MSLPEEETTKTRKNFCSITDCRKKKKKVGDKRGKKP